MGCLKYKAITDTRHKRQWDQIMEINERFAEKGSNYEFSMQETMLRSSICLKHAKCMRKT